MARKQPRNLTITITSDPPNLVDLVILVEQGGQVSVGLGESPTGTQGNFKINIPGGIRDQKHWIVDKRGMRPFTPA